MERRNQVALTLRYIGREQEEVARNNDWLDQAAHQSRVTLLDRLNEWYITELDQIDKALERFEHDQYGICLTCHAPIEPSRLELSPEAACCAACQRMREELARA